MTEPPIFADHISAYLLGVEEYQPHGDLWIYYEDRLYRIGGLSGMDHTKLGGDLSRVIGPEIGKLPC